ncbi:MULTISPECIES: hypothetical protein [Myxococcus]|uniref:hypothetical protein n=1 Tax=Myxococcus TaxID=32 RepID=UPI0013CF9F80|nr:MULTISPECIES: hypothetical protein [Myxococcus]NVJ27048.1 hypothetical protein [Myxococcus sp. AM011]
MSSRMKLLLTTSLCLGPLTGFIAGRATAPNSADTGPVLEELARQRALLQSVLEATRAPSLQMRHASAPPTGSTVDAAWLRAELAQVLREELGNRAPTEPEDAQKKPPAPEPTPQNLAAFQEGTRVIDKAIAARRWTEEDASSLRKELGAMTPAQRDEVIQRLVVTLNTNTLEVRTMGAPF